MYTSEIGEIGKLYRKVGEQCDHIHIDLLDETFDAEAAPVNVLTIAVVRDLYRWHPALPAHHVQAAPALDRADGGVLRLDIDPC